MGGPNDVSYSNFYWTTKGAPSRCPMSRVGHGDPVRGCNKKNLPHLDYGPFPLCSFFDRCFGDSKHWTTSGLRTGPTEERRFIPLFETEPAVAPTQSIING